MIYCYLEDYPYSDEDEYYSYSDEDEDKDEYKNEYKDKDEYKIIGFMDSENHSYDDTVFHVLYCDSFQSTMGRILKLCELNNIEMSVLNQDNNNWSFTIKKSDLDNIKSILHSL